MFVLAMYAASPVAAQRPAPPRTHGVYVDSAGVIRWWDNGREAIAFSRGDKGFVAINREITAITSTIGTGLSAGTYCDILTGDKRGTACVGTSVTIDAAGAIALTLPSNTAIAILASSKL